MYPLCVDVEWGHHEDSAEAGEDAFPKTLTAISPDSSLKR